MSLLWNPNWKIWEYNWK